MGHATNRRNGDLKNASWFAGSAFDFGFPHYFGHVDNRLDTNHATVNQQKKERRKKTMKSKCRQGRKRHRFRHPKTRSLTNDLRCWWCGKTVAQVKEERKAKQ